ncbi:unnamed protein product [Sympodiomycopsis kandeliae]
MLQPTQMNHAPYYSHGTGAVSAPPPLAGQQGASWHSSVQHDFDNFLQDYFPGGPSTSTCTPGPSSFPMGGPIWLSAYDSPTSTSHGGYDPRVNPWAANTDPFPPVRSTSSPLTVGSSNHGDHLQSAQRGKGRPPGKGRRLSSQTNSKSSHQADSDSLVKEYSSVTKSAAKDPLRPVKRRPTNKSTPKTSPQKRLSPLHSESSPQSKGKTARWPSSSDTGEPSGSDTTLLDQTTSLNCHTHAKVPLRPSLSKSPVKKTVRWSLPDDLDPSPHAGSATSHDQRTERTAAAAHASSEQTRSPRHIAPLGSSHSKKAGLTSQKPSLLRRAKDTLDDGIYRDLGAEHDSRALSTATAQQCQDTTDKPRPRKRKLVRGSIPVDDDSDDDDCLTSSSSGVTSDQRKRIKVEVNRSKATNESQDQPRVKRKYTRRYPVVKGGNDVKQGNPPSVDTDGDAGHAQLPSANAASTERKNSETLSVPSPEQVPPLEDVKPIITPRIPINFAILSLYTPIPRYPEVHSYISTRYRRGRSFHQPSKIKFEPSGNHPLRSSHLSSSITQYNALCDYTFENEEGISISYKVRPISLNELDKRNPPWISTSILDTHTRKSHVEEELEVKHSSSILDKISQLPKSSSHKYQQLIRSQWYVRERAPNCKKVDLDSIRNKSTSVVNSQCDGKATAPPLLLKRNMKRASKRPIKKE